MADWPGEKIAQLRELWATGLSTAEIGRRMGISKSAAVGKAHRLNLPPRPSPILRDQPGAPPRPRPPPRAGKATLPPLPPLPAPAPPPAPRPPPVHQPPAPPPAPDMPVDPPLRWRGRVEDCCWPIGEPGSRGFRYCDAPSEPGRPYCREHFDLSRLSRKTLEREIVPVRDVEAYAGQHRVVVPPATGLSGLVSAVNKHRRAKGLVPFAVRQGVG